MRGYIEADLVPGGRRLVAAKAAPTNSGLAKSEPTKARKAEFNTQLLRYCRFDTEAMVGIV